MKVFLVGLTVFAVCYALGAAMVEFIFMIKESLAKQEEDRRD
jgi:hypothetical protein